MSYLSWTGRWSSVIILDQAVLPNEYEMVINFDPKTDDIAKTDIAFQRIKYIIEDVMNNNIMICIDDPRAYKFYKEYNSRVVTYPEEPLDQLIAYVLVEKFNCILDDVAYVNDVLISSRLGDGIRNLAVADETKDMRFIHDSKIRNLSGDKPWWHRSDAGCTDIIHMTKKKVMVIKDKIDWEELDLGWKPKPKIKVDNEPGKVIKFPGRKLRVIQGGK